VTNPADAFPSIVVAPIITVTTMQFDNDSENDHDAIEAAILATCIATSWIASLWYVKLPQYTDRLRGARLVDELLYGHPLRLYEFCRIRHNCFLKLHQ
jgi:hypothetical protein